MRIGITCYPTYGGSGVVATELGIALAERGHQVHFISYANPFRLNRFVENVFYHEVEQSTYPLFEFNLYTLALASKLVEVAQFEELDILHMHYAIPHATSAFLAREMLGRRNIRIITTLHGTDITLVGLEPSFLPLMKFSILQSDGVTAVSRSLREKTLVNYGIEKEIEVIPNFVDTARFARIDSGHFRGRVVPGGEPVLVHVSNFRSLKRVGDAIRVAAAVRQKIPVKLLLVGDGPDRAECERLARELGVADAVLFLGKQEALVEILSASDIFLLPSQSESFGLSALEAMSCGLPAITTSVGGLPELNVHGETGYICEIGDVERMAKYAVELISNPSRYARFSEAARRRAVEMFDASIIIPKYEQYYERVLQGS